MCTGLQLVNFLQDVPRDLELGRVYLPAEDRARFGEPALDRPSAELRELLRFEAARAPRAPARGRGAARAHRRAARPRGRALLPRRPRGARRARGGGLGRVLAAAEAVALAARARGGARHSSSETPPPPTTEVLADHAARGEELRVRDHGAAARQAARDRGDLRVRAARRRRRRRRARAGARSASRSRRCARRSTREPRRSGLRRARRRARALRHPARAARGARRRRPPGSRAADVRRLRRAARLLREGRRRGRARVPSRVRLGRHRARARRSAIALQLINIIRDVDEDRQLGRVYLPQDELTRFGVEPASSRRRSFGS